MSAEPKPTPVEWDDRMGVLISLEMVRLYKEQFGRPKRASTQWAGPDALMVILEDTLSSAERNMLEDGEHERVRDKRSAAQYAKVREFCEPIERISGRKVRSFLSATDTKVDGLSLETFLLHPVGYDGPSRIDAEDQPPRAAAPRPRRRQLL